jgi:hypothetical protein
MTSVPSINWLIRSSLIAAVIMFAFTPSSFSQSTSGLKKFSPLLEKKWQKKKRDEVSEFVVAVSDEIAFRKFLAEKKTIISVYEHPESKTFVIKTSWSEILRSVLPLPQILFVDEQRKAREEMAVSNLDLSANKVNAIHNSFPQYNGNGIVVSIKENRPDTLDIDFRGRYISTHLSSTIFSTHATAMMSIAGGGGNSFYEGKGGAWASSLTSSDFSTLLPDPGTAYQQYSISVQNHSYGTGIENFYGADAAAYDASVIARPSLLHIFSAGNSGLSTSTTGAYSNIAGYANITGSFKMAKNIITVGHTDSFGTVLSPSSRGPGYDGRIKPELVAFALDGSSGAAAIVSGIAGDLQQAYKDLHGPLPSAALVKAILLNSADDVGARGIDFVSGYGAANAYKAMTTVLQARHFTGSLSTSATDVLNITVPPNTRQLKLTLAWSDPPAVANAAKVLKNDLDLELTLPSSSQTWLPWVLSHAPHLDSLQKLPVRKRDSLNNVEQITIDDPVAGNYQVLVKGFNVTTNSPQEYFLAYQLDTADQFTWLYPGRLDNIFGGRSNVLRWSSTYSNSTGQLEYSINNGTSWQLVDNAVDLSKAYYKWIAPDSFKTALLRINFASQNFRSDTFTISNRFDLFVGFNCPDSFMIFWNKIPGVNNYQLYRLGSKYMEPFLITTDTAVILAKATNSSLYYAVAPIIASKTGLRTHAHNYTLQGVACYIKTFSATLVGSSAGLDLQVGTGYKIKFISFQKFTGAGFIDLQSISNITGLQFGYTDNNLTKGLNIYRAKIELTNGFIIYTDLATVYYFSGNDYIVYPNPAQQYQPITILSNDLDLTRLQVFNSVGQKIYEKILDQLANEIPAGKLSKGFYFLRIIKNNRTQTMMKLVVY